MLHRNVASWAFHNFSAPPESIDATRLSSADSATFSTTLVCPSKVLSRNPSDKRQIFTSPYTSPDTRSEPFADMARDVNCSPAPPCIHKMSGASPAIAAHPSQTNAVIDRRRPCNRRKTVPPPIRLIGLCPLWTSFLRSQSLSASSDHHLLVSSSVTRHGPGENDRQLGDDVFA